VPQKNQVIYKPDFDCQYPCTKQSIDLLHFFDCRNLHKVTFVTVCYVNRHFLTGLYIGILLLAERASAMGKVGSLFCKKFIDQKE
jgi:hypothetical protein